MTLPVAVLYVWGVVVQSDVVRAVRELAPDGDWVTAEEVGAYLDIAMSRAVIALDAAVSAGDLGSTWWDPVEIDGMPVGAPTMRYRLRTV